MGQSREIAILAGRFVMAPDSPLRKDCSDTAPNKANGSATDAMDETVAKTDKGTQPGIGKFEIRRELGRGGQATVFLAWDPDLSRHVVLKHYHNTESDEDVERVLAEGRALARVDSPAEARFCAGG